MLLILSERFVEDLMRILAKFETINSCFKKKMKLLESQKVSVQFVLITANAAEKVFKRFGRIILAIGFGFKTIIPQKI